MSNQRDKQRWLLRYGEFVREATRRCAPRDRPKDEYVYTVGHAQFARGDKSPKQAAQFYLNDTRYGKLACTRKVVRRAPRRSDGNSPRTKR